MSDIRYDIRYIVRDNSMARGVHEDECSIYVNELAAQHKLEWINRNGSGHGHAFQVDLYECLPFRPTDEQRFQHAERVHIASGAVMDAIGPTLGLVPDKPKVDEIARLRAAIAAMEPIVNAANDYIGTLHSFRSHDADHETLVAVVTANRSRVADALASVGVR